MKKTFSLFLLVLTVTISLAACTPRGINNSSGEIFSSSSSSADNISSEIPSHNEMNSSSELVSTVSETLSSGVIINATVSIPAETDFSSLATYQGALQRLDVEKVKDTFLGVDTDVNKTEQESRESRFPDATYTLYETQDGSFLSDVGDTLTFSSSKLPHIEDYLWLEPCREYNGDAFLTGREFPFGSQQECFEEVRDVLKLLDIQVTDEYICYSIDHDKLMEEAEKFRNETLIRTRQSGATNEDGTSLTEDDILGYLPEPVYSAEDDCYYFKVFASADGFPITRVENGIMENGGFTPGSVITAIYSKDGIVSLSCSSVYQETEKTGEAKGLDLQAAISALDEKYNSLIPDGEYKVQEIAFEYVPISQGDGLSAELVPAWRFQMKHTVEVSEKSGDLTYTLDLDEYVLLNALTGKEILRDVGNI